MEDELETLREQNRVMRKILSSIAPDRVQGPFICGVLGTEGDDGLHYGYLICPAYGTDIAVAYMRGADATPQY